MRALQRPPAADEGFSLIEVVMAMTVLAVLAAAVSTTLIGGMGVSKQARERVAAANLAAREIEIVRNKFASSDSEAMAVASAGTVVNGNPLGAPGPSYVDGTAYTVTRDVQWLPMGTGASACDGGALVNHPSLRVSVRVSWPDMRFVKPVRSDTLLTPTKGSLANTTLSFVAVKVQNARGGPSDGVPVAATGPGGTYNQITDASGCAVFQVGTAGTYTISMDTPGWVDQTGVQKPTKSSVVSAGQLARQEMTYDQAASLTINLVTDAGFAIPRTPYPSVNWVQPNVPTSSARRTVLMSSTSTTVTGLWPSLSGYASWPGGCNDSDPAGPPTMGSQGAPTVLAPGGSGSVDARLAPMVVDVKDDAGAAAPDVQVIATSADCPGGTADLVLDLGRSDASGRLMTSLPFGRWVLSAKPGGKDATLAVQPAATGTTTVTLAP